MRRFVIAVVMCAVNLAPLSAAEGRRGYARLPALGGKGKTLRIKIVGYKGGKMHVKVRNVGASAATFKAHGLYFVPKGKPESAPQRMGAAGPMEISEAGTWKRRRSHAIKARSTATIRLAVFCLDSHRASPSNGQPFTVAKRRLPRKLRRQIVRGTRRIYAKKRRYKRPSRRSIQGFIWKTRNRRWIKLQGERKAEKSGRARPSRRQYRHRRPRRHYKRPNRLRRVVP